jgi:hypothetical protein
MAVNEIVTLAQCRQKVSEPVTMEKMMYRESLAIAQCKGSAQAQSSKSFPVHMSKVDDHNFIGLLFSLANFIL